MHSASPDLKLPIMDNRTYSLTGELESLDCHAVAAFTRLAAEAETPIASIVLEPRPDGTWSYELRSRWADPKDDPLNIAWTRAAVAEVTESRPRRHAA